MKKLKNLTPHTGIPACNVLIVFILVISAIGIFTYGFSAIRYIINGSLSRMFPNIMYILSYLSIVKYCIDYFIKKKYVSIYSVVASFSLVIMLTTLNIQDVNNQLVAIAICVFILTTFVKNALTHFKRCVFIIILVFIAVIALMLLKFYYGYLSFDSNDPFEVMITIYSSYRLAILWGLFALMYIMRYCLVRHRYKEYEKTHGHEKARQSYFSELRELAKFEALAKIDARYKKDIKPSKKISLKNK